MFGIKTALRNLDEYVTLNRVKKICAREFRNQTAGKINERPIEFRFIFKHLTEIYPTTVLDVGTGATALPHLIRNCGFVVTAIDNVRDYWPRGMVNRHFHVIDDDITNTHLQGKFDFISCVSVLEHVVNHEAAVRNMLSLLNPGGHLAMSFPYHHLKYVKNAYELPESEAKGKGLSFATQVFSAKQVESWLKDGSAEVVDQEFWRFFSGEFWTCGERIVPPAKVSQSEPHHLSCILIRKKPAHF